MIAINLSQEAGKSISEIRKKFSGVLSKEQIDKTLAFTINETARRVISRGRKEMKQEYTINNKYLERYSKIPLKASTGFLEARIAFNYGTVPLIGFKHKDLNKRSQRYFAYNSKMNGVEVEIKKGAKKVWKHAFIKTMRAGNTSSHEGIYAHGYYSSGKFVNVDKKTRSGKSMMTELKTVSPFTMNTNTSAGKRMTAYINNTMPSRFEAIINNKLKKMGAKP